MSSTSKNHHELENGVGLCSKPMWCGGLPAGFCDQPAYGKPITNVSDFERRDGYWEMGRFRPYYLPGLACYGHGGPKKPEPATMFHDSQIS